MGWGYPEVKSQPLVGGTYHVKQVCGWLGQIVLDTVEASLQDLLSFVKVDRANMVGFFSVLVGSSFPSTLCFVRLYTGHGFIGFKVFHRSVVAALLKFL